MLGEVTRFTALAFRFMAWISMHDVVSLDHSPRCARRGWCALGTTRRVRAASTAEKLARPVARAITALHLGQVERSPAGTQVLVGTDEIATAGMRVVARGDESLAIAQGAAIAAADGHDLARDGGKRQRANRCRIQPLAEGQQREVAAQR